MTLHRELEESAGVISNNNGFKQGTIFDHERDIVGELRNGEATILHNNLLQLFQALHFKQCNVRERERSNVNGLEIREAY